MIEEVDDFRRGVWAVGAGYLGGRECVGESLVAAASGEIVSRLRGENNSAVKVLQTGGILEYRLVSMCEYNTVLYCGM